MNRKAIAMVMMLGMAVNYSLLAGGEEEAAGAGGAVMNAAGLPIVNETVTYTMWAGISPNWGDPSDGSFWREREAETNVAIDWITVGSSEAREKFNLMMSAGDYPDAFMTIYAGISDVDVINYGSQGVYIQLEELIQQWMPKFRKAVEEQDPRILALSTAPDGHIYGLPMVTPAVAVYNNGFINQVWLDNLGLDLPTTTGEFADVLRAFRDNDANDNGNPNDEIPLTFKFTDWGAYDHGPYMGAFGYPLNQQYVLVDNGQVVFLGNQEGFKEGAKWLAELYGEGLIDPESFSFTQASYGAKCSAQPAICGVFHSWDREIIAGVENRDQYAALPPLLGPGGERNVQVESNEGFRRNVFRITDKAENPEILMRWADEFYRDNRMAVESVYGPIGEEGEGKIYIKDGTIYKPHFVDLAPEFVRGQQNLPFVPTIVRTRSGMPIVDLGNADKRTIAEEYKRLGGDKFASGEWSTLTGGMAPWFTQEEAEEVSIINTDLVGYAKQKLAEWIAGDADPEAEWDSYLRELEKIGLQRWLEIHQAGYERLLAVLGG